MKFTYLDYWTHTAFQDLEQRRREWKVEVLSIWLPMEQSLSGWKGGSGISGRYKHDVRSPWGRLLWPRHKLRVPYISVFDANRGSFFIIFTTPIFDLLSSLVIRCWNNNLSTSRGAVLYLVISKTIYPTLIQVTFAFLKVPPFVFPLLEVFDPYSWIKSDPFIFFLKKSKIKNIYG